MARVGSVAEVAREAEVPRSRAVIDLRSLPDHRRSRHLAAAALGLGMVAIPVLAAFAVAIAASRLVSPPAGAALVVWWLVVFAASALAAFGAQGLVRQWFPLVGLLRLALVFPADVPSRLGLAMRAGSVRELGRGVIDLRDGAMDDPAVAAAHVVAFAGALQRHDRFTRGHSERVRAYTDLLAAEYGVPKQARDKLRWAALLHDIGKLEVSTTILNKPAALDGDEWLEMHAHAAAGARLGEPLRAWLGDWVDGIGQHHERFDGSGYPGGVVGEEISLGGRIVALADSYETMTAARPYKKPMTHVAARQELVDQAGRHFDPVVVHAMLRLSIRRVRWAAGPLAALGDILASRLISGRGRLALRSFDATTVLRAAATSAAVATVSLAWSGGNVPAPAPSDDPAPVVEFTNVSTEAPVPMASSDATSTITVPAAGPAVDLGGPAVTTAAPSSSAPTTTTQMTTQMTSPTPTTTTPTSQTNPANPAIPPVAPGDQATPAAPARPASSPHLPRK